MTAQNSSRPDVHFATRAVHGGRGDLRGLGVHALPLDLSTTNPLPTLESAGESLETMAAGGDPGAGGAVYGRLTNPTVARFEEALASLEGGAGSTAFASGMAALTAVLMAATLRRDGRHVVAVRPLYGGSDHLLATGLLGFDVTWTDATDIAAAVRDDTVLVVLETPANPTLDLVDTRDAKRQAGDVPLLVDSTFATPVLQRPLELGADLVMHSATKFLGGHGDVMGGAVAASDRGWIAALRQIRIATGAVLHPLAGYLLHRGLQTLTLRVEKATDNAEELVRRLAAHPAVVRVHYPSGPLVGSQMSAGGSLLSFEVASRAGAARVIESVRLMTPAVSLGSVDTLIQHPAALTHRLVPEATRQTTGISEGLIRLSVGLENVDDLWNDLAAALGALEDRPADPLRSAAGG
ncbi:MAG: PLP-dependent aspartate aminotransferase family protein [Acidobacteriota bacterium]